MKGWIKERKRLRMAEMFIVLIIVMVSWVYTDVKIKLYTLNMCSLLPFTDASIKLYKRGRPAFSAVSLACRSLELV